MPYTSPAAQSSGAVAPVSWATAVKAATDYLANPPFCRVFHNTTQAMTHGAYTTVTFNSEESDTTAMHDTATNPSRITFPDTGIYEVHFHGQLIAAGDYTLIKPIIILNAGNSVFFGPDTGTINTSGATAATYCGGSRKFTAGDFIQAQILHVNTAAAARNLVANPFFTARWVGLG